MLSIIRLVTRLIAIIVRRIRTRRASDHGQSTAEYALVLLGAATVALIFIAWAGGTDTITNLFDAVMDTIIGNVT